jgi:hypothetical protein
MDKIKKTSNTEMNTAGLKEVYNIFDKYMKGMDAMSNKAYEEIDSEEKK